MSRPKPNIICEYTEPKSYKSEQVLEAKAIYAVFYDGGPINLRTVNVLLDYPPNKYRKTSHSNSGHAFNLAERLNKLFKTNKFMVYKLTQGVCIHERSIEDTE